jgi:hypothetical protein
MSPPTPADYLSAQQPLYAVLDAARDAGVPELLRGGGAEHGSLYDGPSAAGWAAIAPYLVRLEAGAAPLGQVTTRAWGQSSAIYLTCDRPFAEVRRHLRRFLRVAHAGATHLFRFYDPRVLRRFLPVCTAGELAELFGPLDAYFTESRDPAVLLRFTRQAARSGGERIDVAAGGSP